MLPASLGPASKESIKITECLQGQIESNRLFLTVVTKQRYRGKQRFFFFPKNLRNERKNWSLQKQFISEEKFQKFTFMLPFFLSPISFSFVFCQKQLGLTLQAVTSRPSPASYNRENFAVGWSGTLADTQPPFTHMRCKDRGKKKSLFLFEPEFVPWGQTYYSTLKEVFHAITEQIDMD